MDKSTGTFADNLAAFGLAFVIRQIAGSRARVTLRDDGGAFAVVCDPPITAEQVASCKFFSGAPFLITFDNKSKTKMVKGTDLTVKDIPPANGDVVVDYEDEKRNRTAFFDFRKTLSKDDQRKLARRELIPPVSPHGQWETFRAINPGALQGFNSLMAEWWRGQNAFADVLSLLLAMTSQTPANIEDAEAAWKKLCKAQSWKSKDATAAQLLNPAQGKGTSNIKAEWRDPNNVKAFWLIEWLRAVGLFHGAFTRIPTGTKDRKTYVLNPSHLDWGTHESVMADFRLAMTGGITAVKLDIFAALRYTQSLLRHYEPARAVGLSQLLFGTRPSDLVSGMTTAFYKSLGNSPAVMNMATINLPRWVRPTDAQSLAQLDGVLDEHSRIVNALDETRGDQFGMLLHYRDFLAARDANDLTPFFDFTNTYSGFVISQRERGKYAPQFSTTTLEVLFMNSDDNKKTFSHIVQNAGFQNVAHAIRHSTVVPQGMKGRGNKPVVSIRYGLGQQLARKSAYPDEFLAELAEFLQLYNAENAQLRENKRSVFRKNVTTTDIESVTRLVDEFGAKVVCNLLVAYGYAREPRAEDKADEGDVPVGDDAGDADVDVEADSDDDDSQE